MSRPLHHSIRHFQVRKGWPIKRNYVCVSVACEFEWWELKAIRDFGLTNTVLLDRVPADKWPTEDIGMHALTVEHLMNGRIDKFHCRTSQSASQYEGELIEALGRFAKRLMEITQPC
ncbi:MAG: hypothetical protein ABJM29_16230 [Rhizobiaceae bacterium]